MMGKAMTQIFADNLAQLESADRFVRMRLFDEQGVVCAEIPNQPGSSGSFRVYYHLAVKWGGIGTKAAEEGLLLFAEHTEDARQHPGKHPNIDRLLTVISSGRGYSVRCYLD
jgi:hypothetical protein